MNGIHDMGGMHGFGPIAPERDEPVFHHEWERRVFAVRVAAGSLGLDNIDERRHAIERMDPAEYLRTSYYEHWLAGMETLLTEKGVIRRDAGGTPRLGEGPDVSKLRVLKAPELLEGLRRGKSTRVDEPVAPKFRPGDAVTVHNRHPSGHTRMPRYVRGKRGTIDRDHGVFVFPDTNAHWQGQKPQHVYSVCFDARELWGDDAFHGSVYVDLWDDYLDPA